MQPYLNRDEIIGDLQGVEYDRRFRLEPEWILVILTALVHAGQLTVAIPGKKFDATHLRNSRKTPVNDLINFKHVERPKDLPLAALTALFELLGIPIRII